MRFGYFLLFELSHIILFASCVKAEETTPDFQPGEEEEILVLQEPARGIAIIGDSI